MPRRSARNLLVLALGLLSPLAALDASEASIEWGDTSRDVYLDGEPDPGAEVFTVGADADADDGPRLAVLSARADRAFVVDLDSLAVAALPLAAFELSAGGATSPADAEPLSTGRATHVRDRRSSHYLASAGGHTLLISPHQGPVGDLDLDQLYAAAPSWRRRAAAYQPDAEAVAALAAHGESTEVTVAFGTWCGDSRNWVPRLLRSLEAAGNPVMLIT